jgi:hypothetical protein
VKRVAAAAVMAAAALAGPAAASATVTTSVSGPAGAQRLTVTSDGGADAIRLGTRDGAITVDGTAQAVPADGTTQIVADLNGGDDAVDAVDGVELLDAPAVHHDPTHPTAPARDTTALLPDVGPARVARRHGGLVARVPLACPAAEAGGCTTTLTLTAKAVALGTKTVALAPGQRSIVTIRLAHRTRRLARRGRVLARLGVSSVDAAGNRSARSVRVGLRIPRRS